MLGAILVVSFQECFPFQLATPPRFEANHIAKGALGLGLNRDSVALVCGCH